MNGPSPFARSLVSQSVSFFEGNASVSVTGLDSSEINASLATVVDFNNTNFGYDLNASAIPSTVRVFIDRGAVENDGNLSQAGAFEFEHRTVTAVEDDLLAWYPMDDFSREVISDLSGRMRHGTYVGFDATDLSTGIVSQSGQVGSTLARELSITSLPLTIRTVGELRPEIYPRPGYPTNSPHRLKSLTIPFFPVPINNNLDNRSPGNW